MPAPLTSEELLTIPTFQELPPQAITWLLTHGERRVLADGEALAQPGAPAEFMMAVLRGGVQFFSLDKGSREPRFRLEAGQVSGVLPYSRLRTLNGLALATGPTELYLLHRDRFPELEHASPELVQRLVGLMSDRAREEARGQERDEKLRALGKLAAGLAHELNNPAAAIARAAEALAERALAKPALFVELVGHCPSPAAMHALTALARPGEPAARTLSALEEADREDELADWLEAQGVPDGYRLAAGLLEASLTLPALEPVAALLPAGARAPAFAWLEGQLVTMHLIRDVQEAGGRISQLVSNVKTYSHMDRGGDFTLLDVPSGLDSTVNMLGFALREQKLTLRRDYAPDLPPVRGQVSSLNQVWTNLLDNAIDALPPGGEITLRTRLEGGFVRVFVIDNGPGIAPEVLPRIFEPFYTTKQAGEGTGLGLDIAQRIIRDHGGRLEVKSAPGHTEFCAWLPVGE
ncbi:Histidine kinase-, DNA gyrase B-, and HSP90-like ATPase [Hymenobacter daecheongensis DSM 21074]|uniref:histidine kinase n=1 Tax=Hymenobacter daecheongensis DSM 21074 TaxID=1121955 RepID=A0A1M6AZT7_9BACT|nr:ATP-binding protein [Hymenobacter daecheongensis]SHI41828.1 Histidine kinase-, DNA gyrase B-, and HSP90-like ATPase [Hymenobacter daecheongensis DSM 21074]